MTYRYSSVEVLRSLARQTEGCREHVLSEWHSFEFALIRPGFLRTVPLANNVRIAREMLAAVRDDPMVFEEDGDVALMPAAPVLWDALERIGEWSLSHEAWGRSYREAWSALPAYAWCLQGTQDNAIWTLTLAREPDEPR